MSSYHALPHYLYNNEFNISSPIPTKRLPLITNIDIKNISSTEKLLDTHYFDLVDNINNNNKDVHVHNKIELNNNNTFDRFIEEEKDGFDYDNEMNKYTIFSALIGLQDMLAEIDTYALYFLLVDLIGCNFYSFYGIMLTLVAFVQLIWWPTIGAFTDYCDRSKTNLLVWATRFSCLTFNIAFACLLVAPSTPFIALYIIRSMFGNLLWILSWKLLKLRVEDHNLPSSVQEKLLNIVCSRGDVYAQFVAVTILVCCVVLVILQYFTVAKYFLLTAIISMGSLVTLCSFLFLHNTHIKEEFILEPSKESSIELITSLSISSIFQSAKEYYNIFSDLNVLLPFMHANILYIVWYCVSVPIALSLNTSSTIGSCNGLLYNLVIQGLFTQFGYIVSGPVYFKYISEMDNTIFYGSIFPISALFFIAFLIMVSTGLGLSNLWLCWILLSFTNSWIYYLTSYDFYVLSSRSPSKYSGSIQSLYWWTGQLISIGPGALLALDTNVSYISYSCLIISCIAVLLSFYMKKVFSTTN